MSSQVKILCDAKSFGYGPIGTFLAVSSYFPKEWEVILIADNSSLELARQSGFENIVQCDTDNMDEVVAQESLFLECDLFISLMNTKTIAYAQSLGTRTAHIDALYFMRDFMPDSLESCDCYIVQDFPWTLDTLERLPVSNPVIVGGTVDLRFRSDVIRQPEQLLINLGGLRGKNWIPGVQTNYPFIVADILSQALSEHTFSKVLFTGDTRTMRILLDTIKIPRAEYRTLSHSQFLKELDQSKLAITSPGLTAMYECFAYGIPTVFLPPQSLSQYFTLDGLRKENAIPYSYHWRDSYPEVDLELGYSWHEGNIIMLELIKRFESDSIAQRKLENMLRKALHETDLPMISSNQRKFATIYGIEGAAQAALAIEEVITTTKTKRLESNIH